MMLKIILCTLLVGCDLAVVGYSVAVVGCGVSAVVGATLEGCDVFFCQVPCLLLFLFNRWVYMVHGMIS